MQITTISCGRTYNTTNYTSHRFDFTAGLDPGDRVEDALLDMAIQLHAVALDVMREMGVHYIVEPGGTIKLTPETTATEGEEEEEPIPF